MYSKADRGEVIKPGVLVVGVDVKIGRSSLPADVYTGTVTAV